MLFEKINAWLTASDDYQEGVDLLRETGYSGFKLSVFALGESSFNRGRLEEELRRWVSRHDVSLTVSMDFAEPGLARAAAVVISTKSAIGQRIILNSSQEPGNKIDDSSALADLQKRISALLDERAELKAQLRATLEAGNTDEVKAVRLLHALRIKAITRQLDELYSHQDFYKQHGYLPLAKDPAVEVDDTVALMNARSYVSRYKAKLKKKDLMPEQRQSAQSLLQQYTAEKIRLEIKLNKKNDPDSTRQQTADRREDPPPIP